MIIHLDADAFFASVEQAADPRLRGRPVAVGGERRGIIASASYEARRQGVYTPMPTSRARRVCPDLVVVPGDYAKYEQFSRFLFSYAYDFTPLVEVSSIDEGYLDVAGNSRYCAEEVADLLRKAIRQSLKLEISEGVAANKLTAQVASKLRKPAAFEVVPPGSEAAFLAPLPNRWLPGVGPRLGHVLDGAGVRRIGQVAALSLPQLSLLAGGMARTLAEYARGVDSRPVVPEPPEAKSYSLQETFDQDVTAMDVIRARARSMTDVLFRRIRAEGKAARTLTLRLRYNDMDEVSRGCSLSEPTDLETDWYSRLDTLLHAAWTRRVSIRLLGVRLTNIYPAVALELPLGDSRVSRGDRQRLARALDALQHSGLGPVMRGHDLWLRQQEVVAGKDLPPRRLRLGGAGVLDPDLQRLTPGNRQAILKADNCISRSGLPAGGEDGFQRETVAAETRGAYRLSAHHQIRMAPASADPYVPLNAKTCYDFMNSLLSPAELVATAAEMGLDTLAVTDPNLHGLWPLCEAGREYGVRIVVGAEVRIYPLAREEGVDAVHAYVETAEGYANLCELLSLERPGRVDLAAHADGLVILPAAESPSGPIRPEIRYRHASEARMLRILQSVRTLTLLDRPHPEKLTGRFHFPSPADMASRCRNDPGRLRATRHLADRCTFQPEWNGLQFPHFSPPDGTSPRAFLRRLVHEGMRRHYPHPPPGLTFQVDQELEVIAEVGYEEYFLVVWDILQECRARGIEWITRGSAGDSLVCRCLEFSDFCPRRYELYFQRFLNRDRMRMHKLPDIDLDFPHDRKDEVVALILAKYGPEHAAVVGGFNTFRARSAVAEIAKVLGVSDAQIRKFTEHLPWSGAAGLSEALTQVRECADLPVEEEPYATALRLAIRLDGFPRYPKMHPCGLVLSRRPIRRTTPTFLSEKGWPTTHFDMDAVEEAGLVKMDILAQGGLAVLRDTEILLHRRGIAWQRGGEPEDPRVWRMIAEGGARGVHHIESPAMTQLARLCSVRRIEDLIAVVSVIRPGAANTLRKVQFARRCQGMEPVEYADPTLETVLRTTYGVMAYEEHVLQICEAFAGIPPGESDVLRRALVKRKDRQIAAFAGKFREAALRRGRDPAAIDRVWALLRGFRGYAFCRAHSTAYGLEAYEAARLKLEHPAEFLACVLTHGKGFYSRAMYAWEARVLGIEFALPCLNRSQARIYTVEMGNEGSRTIRLPLAQINGVGEQTLQRWEEERRKAVFAGMADFFFRVQPDTDEMELMLRTGVFDGLEPRRTRQMWTWCQLRRFPRGDRQGWLFLEDVLEAAGQDGSGPLTLIEPSLVDRLASEEELLGFSVSGHPLDRFPGIDWNQYVPADELPRRAAKGGGPQKVCVAGRIMATRLHHQADGQLMKFLTLADRTGFVEVELFGEVYRRYGGETVRHAVLEVEGVLECQIEGMGSSVRALRVGAAHTRGLSREALGLPEGQTLSAPFSLEVQ